MSAGPGGVSETGGADGAGGVGGPFGIHFAEGVYEGKGPTLVVEEDSLVIARLDTAEGQGHATGEAECTYGGGNIGAEGNEARGPADLDSRLEQLLGEGGAALVGVHEDVDILLLIRLGNLLGDLRARRRADDGGKPRGGAVHELYASLAEDEICGRP